MTPGMFIPLSGCAKLRYFLQWNFAVVGTPKLQDVSGFRTQSLMGALLALLGGSHEQTGKLGTKNGRRTQKTGTRSEKQASNIEKIWSLKAVCLPSVQLTGWWFGK